MSHLCGPLRNLCVLCVNTYFNAEGAESTQRIAEEFLDILRVIAFNRP
jgi:hypothetical protein